MKTADMEVLFLGGKGAAESYWIVPCLAFEWTLERLLTEMAAFSFSTYQTLNCGNLFIICQFIAISIYIVFFILIIIA